MFLMLERVAYFSTNAKTESSLKGSRTHLDLSLDFQLIYQSNF